MPGLTWGGGCRCTLALCCLQSHLWHCWSKGSRELWGRDPETALLCVLTIRPLTCQCPTMILFRWEIILYYGCVNTYGILTVSGFTLPLNADLWKLMPHSVPIRSSSRDWLLYWHTEGPEGWSGWQGTLFSLWEYSLALGGDQNMRVTYITHS